MMNRELRKVVYVIIAMFLSLFVSSSTIQVLTADSLTSDPRNVRAVYDSYKTRRGAILVEGTPIAESVRSDDNYHYARKYLSPMYSSITGFFSFFQGATGLESSMNQYLTGKSSSQFFEQVNALLSGNPLTGASIELTIDPKVQSAAWNALGDLQGAVVAIEPSTGNILAMVSKPGYDANALATHDGVESAAAYATLLADKNTPLVNKAITGTLYAPGSVFKIVVAAAAFESGKYTPESTLPNPTRYQLPGTKTWITNSGEGKCGGKPTVSIATALMLSCNIPFAQLGIEIGQDAIRSQAEKFGFSKSVDIPLRSTPSTYPDNMDDAQTALSAFGQFDDRVTPLQIAMISAAVANGGSEMKPTLIQNVQSANLASLWSPQPEQYSSPISAQTANWLKQMMINAVAKGVSSNGQIKGVDVAGKTGTAQNGKGEPYTLWFTGFAPANNPKVAIAVVIENGGGIGQAGRGNTLAAPVARKVMEAVLGK
jgi:peptidoglycan glycosyltransferase